MPAKVIFSVTNDIATDNRVLRHALLMVSAGHDVLVVGRRLPGSIAEQSIPVPVRRFRMIARRGFLFYKMFNIRLFFFMLFNKADLLIANDLDTLLPNFLVSKFKKVPLIYDAHEYFTGVPELEKRSFVRGVWKWIEKRTVPAMKYMITVNDSIADLYHNEYNVDPVVIRNIHPKGVIRRATWREFGLPEDQRILVMQGTGINMGRGGSELVRAMESIVDAHLAVIGGGDEIDKMKADATDRNLMERITFYNTMPRADMMAITSIADIGLSLDAGTNVNNRNSLPNKIFDYLEAGLAIIATDLPEIRKIVAENECGVLIPTNSPDDISQAVNNLLADNVTLKRFKRNSKKTRDLFTWKSESEGFGRLVNEALGGR